MILALLSGPVLAAVEPPLDPETHQALYQAQTALIQHKDPQRAAEILEDLSRRGALRPHYLVPYILGLARLQQNRLPEAKAAFDKALTLKPDHFPSCLNLAGVLYQLKRPGEAAALWEKAFGLAEKPDPTLLYQAAAAWYEAAEYGQSVRVLNKLLAGAVKPPPEWLKLLVHAGLNLKDLRSAEAALDRFLAARPGEADYWRLLAQVRLEKNDSAGAAAALEVAGALHPLKAAEVRTLAGLYIHLKAPLQAARTLEQGLGREAGIQDHLLAARLLAQAGQVEKAARQFDLALDKKPSAEGYLEKGRLLFEAGQFRAALAAFRAAAREDPAKGEAHFLLGLSALEVDEPALARQALLRAAGSREFKSQAEAALGWLEALEDDHPKPGASRRLGSEGFNARP